MEGPGNIAESLIGAEQTHEQLFVKKYTQSCQKRNFISIFDGGGGRVKMVITHFCTSTHSLKRLKNLHQIRTCLQSVQFVISQHSAC